MHLSLSAKLGKLSILFSASVRDYFSRLDAAGLRVREYDAANAALIDRLVGNGGNFWPDSGAFCAMAGYLFPVENPSIPPLYNERMYFDGVDDDIGTPALLPATDDFTLTINLVPQANTVSIYGSLSAASGGRHVIQVNADGKAFVFIGGVAALTTTNSFNFNQINTLVLSRSGSNWSLTLNDGTPETVTGSTTLDTDGSNIGDPYAGANFKGVITSLSVGAITWDGTSADATAKGWTVNGSPALFTGQGIPGSTLVPLHPNHDAGTLNAFVSGDWNAVTGLKGDGSTKYVDSNRANDADGRDDNHASAFFTQINTGGANRRDVIGVNGTNRYITTDFDLGRYITRNNTGAGADATTITPEAGLLAVSRIAGANYVFRRNKANGTLTKASSVPSDVSLRIFGNPTRHSDGRIAIYTLGQNLNGTGELAELDAALTEWKNALANA